MIERQPEVALGELSELSLSILENRGLPSVNGSTIRFREGSEQQQFWFVEAKFEYGGILAVSRVCTIELQHIERGQGIGMTIPPEEGSSYFQRDSFITYLFERFIEVA